MFHRQSMRIRGIYERVFVLMLLLMILSASQTSTSDSESWFSRYKSLFTRIRSVGGARFYPGKSYLMLYENSRDGTLQLWMSRSDGHRSRRALATLRRTARRYKPIGSSTKTSRRSIQLTSYKNRASSARFLNSRGHILFYHDRGGDEHYQIGVLKPSHRVVWLTNDLKAKHMVNYITARHLYYTSNERNKKYFDILRRTRPLTGHEYRIKINGQDELVSQNPDKPSSDEFIYKAGTDTNAPSGVAHIGSVSRDEKSVILVKHFSNFDHELFFMPIDSQKLTSLTRRGFTNFPKIPTRSTRWSPIRFLDFRTRKRLLVKTDFNSEYNRLAILYWKDGDYTKVPKFIKLKRLEPIKMNVRLVTYNYRTKTTLIEYDDNQGCSSVIMCRISLNGRVTRVRELPLPIPRAVISTGDPRTYGSGVSFSRDGRKLLVTMSNSVTPSTIYRIDLSSTKRVTFLRLLSSLSEKDRSLLPSFVSSVPRKFKTSDGLYVHYFKYVPKSKKSAHPVVILCHGGPEAASRPSFSAFHQYLVNLGFIVIVPNIRGSTNLGRSFADADNQEKRLDAIRDLNELAHVLKKDSRVLGDRIFILGGSYGGFASLSAVTEYPDTFAGAVDIVGVSSFITFFEHTAEWRRSLRYEEYGNFHIQKELLKQISPINHVNRVIRPVFLISGKNDERVPYTEAKSFYEKLMERSKLHPELKKSEIMIFDDEGHGLSKLSNRLKAYERLGKWLKDLSKE